MTPKITRPTVQRQRRQRSRAVSSGGLSATRRGGTINGHRPAPARARSAANEGLPKIHLGGVLRVLSDGIPCRDCSMGRLVPLAGKGVTSIQHESIPRHRCGGFCPKRHLRAGGSSDPPRDLVPQRFGAVATRWASHAGYANQVSGSSPRGAHRGRKDAGGTSSWEVEPKHVTCGAALVPFSFWSECRPGGELSNLRKASTTTGCSPPLPLQPSYPPRHRAPTPHTYHTR